MFTKYFVFIVLSTLTLASANDDPSLHRFRGHVIKNGEKYDIVTGLESSYQPPTINANKVLATGFWDQTYNITGWSVLEIKTSENQTNFDQAYSAGLLEGQLTRGEIVLLRINLAKKLCL
jgi:hypothetical protein